MSSIEVFYKNINSTLDGLNARIRTDMIQQYRGGYGSVDCVSEYLLAWNSIPTTIGICNIVKQTDGRFKNNGRTTIWCSIDCSLLVDANIGDSWYANIYKYEVDNVSRTTHAFIQTIAQDTEGAQSKSASTFITLIPQQSFGITITPIGGNVTLEEDLCFLRIICGAVII